MAKNIEINIMDSSGNYEVLYPKTTVDNLVSGVLPITKGGTNGTTGSSGLYNLVSGCGIRSANDLKTYSTTTYVPCYYGSNGYRTTIDNLMSGKLKSQVGSYKGTYTINNATSKTNDMAITINTTIGNPLMLYITYIQKECGLNLITRNSKQTSMGSSEDIMLDILNNTGSAFVCFNAGLTDYSTEGYHLGTNTTDNTTMGYTLVKFTVGSGSIKITVASYDAYGDFIEYYASFNCIQWTYRWLIIGY